MAKKLTYKELEQRAKKLEKEADKRKQAEEALRKRTHDLSERVKELNCLYGISHLVEKQDVSFGEILRGTVDLIPPSWEYPEITCARIILEGQEFKTENFTDTAWKQASDIVANGLKIGRLDVCYLEQRPESDEGPFLKEERHLINAIAERLGRISERVHAEEALRHELFAKMFFVSPVPTTITSLSEGYLVMANEAFARLIGQGQDEIIGKSVTDLHVWADPKERKRIGKVLREKGSVQNVDIQVLHTSGKIRNCLYSAVVVEFGTQPNILSMAVDITDRKHAEEALQESEKKYTLLVENALTGIYIDQDGKIVFANDRAGEIYGCTKEDLLGIKTWKLVHPEDRPLTNKMRAKRLKGQDAPSEYEARGLTKDGRTIWIRRRNTRIEYDGGPAVLGNIVDITEQKRAEEELQKINEELKNFVHMVSHDLKSPIISVQGFSSRLLKNYQEKLGDKGVKYLEQIKASSRRMELLVADLLVLSRIGEVEYSFKDVSSHKIVKNVTSSLRARLKNKGIELDVAESLPVIHSDGERICQVFENLLVNAIKFLGDTQNPKIEIGYEDRGALHLFYVKDNGIGIDPKRHRQVFDMFRRLKQTADEEGTGLGLSIVERIVESHGGRVWVESQKGKGAIFYFTLSKEL